MTTDFVSALSDSQLVALRMGAVALLAERDRYRREASAILYLTGDPGADVESVYTDAAEFESLAMREMLTR